ncbi:MAG: TRAM domain-containing protein [Acidobacteria bacterium]|nr:TRAM domain-containing protein [Acidobacteriota bacterium]MDA1234217.1 TRAM domain-containing protein [Acidobacteriota bacterium]
MTDLWVLRATLVVAVAAIIADVRPFGTSLSGAVGLGMFAGAIIVLAEMRLRHAALKRVIGGAVGMVLGVAGAAMAAAALRSAVGESTSAALQILILLLGAYLGVAVGGAQGDSLNLGAVAAFQHEATQRAINKILDTSVIIDGRIAEVAEAGFLDGPIIIPRFVLWELQSIADSADTARRNRGRRGLDMLKRLQENGDLEVKIVEDDFPRLKEVDQKLVELAKNYHGKIVTNDFNLNNLAAFQGVAALNINELANAVKPVVLPGELMHVLIQKEGKEQDQGVAYLDDGTMVVVDHARHLISKKVDISVTSVIQTAAGKMIFGKLEADRGQSRPDDASEFSATANAS